MLVILNNFVVPYTMGKNSSFSNNFITWEQKQKLNYEAKKKKNILVRDSHIRSSSSDKFVNWKPLFMGRYGIRMISLVMTYQSFCKIKPVLLFQ